MIVEAIKIVVKGVEFLGDIAGRSLRSLFFLLLVGLLLGGRAGNSPLLRGSTIENSRLVQVLQGPRTNDVRLDRFRGETVGISPLNQSSPSGGIVLELPDDLELGCLEILGVVSSEFTVSY